MQIFAFAIIITCKSHLRQKEMKIKQSLAKIPMGMKLYYAVLVGWLLTTAMHIPDGYLSPVTCAVMVALVLPFWVRGVMKLRQKLNAKTAPLVALLAAFSFVLMMFNVPIPGGTTAHAVGGALIAIILGPDIACIAVSIALLIQALFFGDGGILSFGANCFNMAVVLPSVSYAIYTAITKNVALTSKRRLWGAGLGAWAGLTVASFFAAVEFGIQPALFHTTEGAPLYAPYSLSVSIPAMVIPHALIASVVEALVTVAVVAYLQRANQPALRLSQEAQAPAELGTLARLRPLWVTLIFLIVLSPIGLLAPGTAWGEWGTEQFAGLGLKFIPTGLAKLSSLWSAPLPDYDVPAAGNANLGYILSAAVGIVIIAVVVWLFTVLVTTGKKPSSKVTPVQEK
jgi:cobalt/nickel transport system permease protein